MKACNGGTQRFLRFLGGGWTESKSKRKKKRLEPKRIAKYRKWYLLISGVFQFPTFCKEKRDLLIGKEIISDFIRTWVSLCCSKTLGSREVPRRIKCKWTTWLQSLTCPSSCKLALWHCVSSLQILFCFAPIFLGRLSPSRTSLTVSLLKCCFYNKILIPP